MVLSQNRKKKQIISDLAKDISRIFLADLIDLLFKTVKQEG